MGDIADVYRETREAISSFVSELPEDKLELTVPATPKWTIRDVISHLTGDVERTIAGDFPMNFFQNFGEAAGVVELNEWTDAMVAARKDRSLTEVLEEWERESKQLEEMMRDSDKAPEGVPFIAGNVLVTDIGVHQQDIYGALGIERDRDSAPIKIGSSGYVVSMGWRLGPAGIPPLRLEMGEKIAQTNDGEPGATVRAPRWEFFRAMSGRRSPDQVRTYDWEGDPEPYIPYFYPYGMREEALVE